MKYKDKVDFGNRVVYFRFSVRNDHARVDYAGLFLISMNSSLEFPISAGFYNSAYDFDF